ncbi:DUF305 domain-containing protein [Streptomyces sp. NPDC002446]
MTSIKHAVRRPSTRRIAVAGAVAAAGLVLAACGNGDGATSHNGHGSKPSATATQGTGAHAAPGAFNDADVMFAQMMIPHHEQALAMSKLADGRARDAEIKRLSGEIAKAQGPEIQKMKSWLKGWGKPASAGSMPGMDHGSHSMDGSGMAGMMSDKDMAELKAAKGEDFDKKFARMMIGHHNGAIDMAKKEQKNGRNATAKKLADDVVKGQSSEVSQLNKILDRL